MERPMSTFYLLPEEEKTTSPRQDRRLRGQKAPFKPREVWAIRALLQIQGRMRELALFNLAIDSKLRGCDLVSLRVRDICAGGRVNERAIIIQKKTHQPVQFELTEPTREVVQRWIAENDLRSEDYVFPSRVRGCTHLSTRQYARAVNRWVACIGLDPHKYGTHSLRRTKAALIYKKTGNLRAVQLLLGHTKVESTVRYLGIDVDDALQIAEQVEL
jgi:integrase